jgi:hypothetical protein
VRDQEGGARRRPLALLDQLLVPVTDLDSAARRFVRDYGLTSLEGGRHPGVGTANRIIPLGGTYIELIAVVDAAEAAAFPRSRRVAAAAELGLPFATWAARTDDLESVREALSAKGCVLPAIQTGARMRPDGVLLKWRTQELSNSLESSVLPFLIEWQVPAGTHPGELAVAHPSRAGDIVAASFTAPDPVRAYSQIKQLVGDTLDLDVVEGVREQLVAVQLGSPSGTITVQ